MHPLGRNPPASRRYRVECCRYFSLSLSAIGRASSLPYTRRWSLSRLYHCGALEIFATPKYEAVDLNPANLVCNLPFCGRTLSKGPAFGIAPQTLAAGRNRGYARALIHIWTRGCLASLSTLAIHAGLGLSAPHDRRQMCNERNKQNAGE